MSLRRKARSMLSGRGGGATRPPATLSCKADPQRLSRRIVPTLQLATDEASDEPKAYLWMAGRALQYYSRYLRAFFFTGQNPSLWSKIGAHA